MDDQVRVGRIVYKLGQQVYPQYPGYIPIVVMTKSSAYGELGPYELRDSHGRILENIWQMSKVYQSVPSVDEKYTVRYPIPVWKHPAEVHIKDGCFTPEFWAWRDKGMKNHMAIRYPVGRTNMHTCKFAIPWDTSSPKEGELISIDSVEKLDYITSRKRTYMPLYCSLVKKQPKYMKLANMIKEGCKLLIIEIDGPHQESMQYYKDKYDISNDFITGSTMIANEKNLSIMLNDSKHPFGHGYCLAASLLGLDDKLCNQ